MKSSHASTRIKTGKVYQDRNMQAWYRQQERIRQLEMDKNAALRKSGYTKQMEQEGK